MKQNIDIEKKAQSTIGQDKHTACDFIQSRMISISDVLPTGRGIQQLGRDGPPGRARSPGINFRKELQPINSPVPELVEGMNINILIKPKIQLFTTFNF